MVWTSSALIVGKGSRRWRVAVGSCGSEFQPIRMLLRVRGEFFEDGREFALRLPAPALPGGGAIHHEPRDVEGPWGRSGLDVVPSKAVCAPIAELRQRHAVLVAAAKVQGRFGAGPGLAHLAREHRS